MSRRILIAALLAGLAPLAASAQTAPGWNKVTPGPAQATPAQNAPAQNAPAGDTGTVKETMDAGGYTYVNVDVGGRDMWLAAPQAPYAKGEKVRWRPGANMSNFYSKSLNRSFPSIQFVDGLQKVK